ncbi:MAG: hypothetical protein AB7C98_11445 [Acidithiobacillus sp.]
MPQQFREEGRSALVADGGNKSVLCFHILYVSSTGMEIESAPLIADGHTSRKADLFPRRRGGVKQHAIAPAHRRDNVSLSPLEMVQTKLVVVREGNRLIVEPEEDSLESLPALFAALRPQHSGERPEFVETERSW